jgi:phage terminase Nu1 subunit (DNA packaging protein)
MDVRRELITEQAAASKLKRLELEGRLIDRETVRRTVFEKTRVARNAILGLAERLPPLLAAEPSEVKIRDMLQVEFRRILDELADGEEQATRQ